MDPDSIYQISIIVILLALSAFFSSAETALSAVGKVRIKSLAEQGNKKALRLEKVVDNYAKMISTILIGNNIVNLSASAMTTSLTISLFGNEYVGIGTGILTLLVLTFGEIVPKTVAKAKAEKISLTYAFFIDKLMWILTPVTYIFDKITYAVSKITGVDMDKADTITENELKAYIDVGHDDGIIESEEHEMIKNVFNFSETVVREIMIPRINIVAINKNLTYDEIASIFMEHMYTRLPVYDKDPDNIIGILNIKDFLFIKDKVNFSLESILREAHYTYEFKKTTELLIEMRKQGYNLVFVLSEYGACVGMITLEDLLEEIVGDIKDEYDDDEVSDVTQVADNLYSVDGSMSLLDLNNQLKTGFSSNDYDSIAGLIIEKLDRLPKIDDVIEFDNGIILKVTNMEQNRVAEVSVKIPADFVNK